MPQESVNPRSGNDGPRLPALVGPHRPRAGGTPPAGGRPLAVVVAQLFGALHDCPQYRARRRERPEIADARYRAAAALVQAPPRLDRRG